MNNSRATTYRHLLLHSPLLILLFGLWIQLSALYDKQHQIHNVAMQAAGTTTTIQGSHLDAGNAITVDTGDLSITASRDTTRSNSSTKSMSASITIGTGGVSGGSIGGGFSKDRSKGTTTTNATLNANTLTLNTSGDASIRGANLHATEATTLNIGGDLEVASLQDRNSHNSVGIDASIGFSTDTDKQGSKTGQTTTASANYNSSNGNYIAVTNQTSITSDGKVNIDTKGNTHLAGALIEGETATSITTATLTTEDIHNRADYNSMSIGASYTHSTSPDQAKDNGISPNIGLPQDVDKSSTTHTAIAENTVINITDPDNQTQDTSKISRDTEHASYTMTQINTEVLDIRADISKDLSKDGFKAVGDLAMREGWEDGSVEKTLAHAAMGAVVAAVGNGDALGGALGAGAAEAARPTTANANDATQQSVSALVGAIAGGGTGASVGLDGEKYNRQLHQDEIKWIEQNAQAFADANNMSVEEAQHLLNMAALGLVDGATSRYLEERTQNGQALHTANGDITDQQIHNAQQYIQGHTVGQIYYEHGDDHFPPAHPMFETTSNREYNSHSYDPNRMQEGATPNTLDVFGLPTLRGAQATSDALRALDGKIDDVLDISLVRPTGAGEAGDAIRTDFYVKPNGDIIPSTGYRAVSGPGAEAADNGNLMSPNGDTYFTFDNPAGKSAEQIKSELQITNTPTHIGEFDTLQVIDDIRVPKEDWGRGTKPEPITRYFGESNPNGDNYGVGGATQAVTKIPIKEFELQEIKK